MERVTKLYFIQGLAFIVLTFALFLHAATGEGRDYTDAVNLRGSDMETFIPFFGAMLILPGLGAALGLLQPYSGLPRRLRYITAGAYGVGLITYLYWHYWVSRQLNIDPETFAMRKFFLVFAGGLLLMITLLVNSLGLFVRHRRGENRRQAGSFGSEGHTMAGLKVFVLGGLVLVMIALSAMWYYGVASWFFGQSLGVRSLQAGLIAYPTCVALGTLAILLGVLQLYVSVPAHWQVLLGIAYVAGVGLFSSALYLDAANNWTGGLSPQLIVGLTLVLTSLFANSVAILFMPAAPTVNAARN